jgi:hypothetical protein
VLAYVLGYSVVLVDSGWSLRNRMSSGEQYKICSIYGNGKNGVSRSTGISYHAVGCMDRHTGERAKELIH